MRKSGFLIVILFFNLFIISCNSDLDNADGTDDTCSSASYEDSTDYIWDSTLVVGINLNTTSINVVGSGATVNGTTVTISSPGTYKITGTLQNGQILVNSEADGAVRLILNGITMTNSTTAPIYIKKSEKTIINLAAGTINSLSDASKYVYSGSKTEPNAAIFSNCNTTIFGSGTLTVKGNYADGIASDDGLIIKSGTITVSAVDDAIRGKDFLIIDDGTITATATNGHALKSNNSTDSSCGYITVNNGTLNLTSTSADGIHATNHVSLKGGIINISASSSQGIKAGSGVKLDGCTLNISKSREGIESADITVNSGTISITASDDGFNSTMGTACENDDGSHIYINGGTIMVNATGGDGLDSNGSIVMTGGTVIDQGPSSAPEVAIDYNGTFNISGGLLIAAGPNSGNMIQATSTSSTQYTVKVAPTATSGMGGNGTSSSSSIGTNIFHIQDANGVDLVTFKPVRSASYVVFSSADLKSASTYSIYTGGTYTGGTIKNGYYTGGIYSGGTLKTTFTLSSKVTSVTMN